MLRQNCEPRVDTWKLHLDFGLGREGKGWKMKRGGAD